MDKLQALEAIKNMWQDSSVDLGTKIVEISQMFYDVGLDFDGTAEYINATSSEFDALLALGGLGDDIIKLISEFDPPKTTWSLLANASDEEIKQALEELSKRDKQEKNSTFSEFVYQKMIEVTGPTQEQLVGMLSSYDIYHAQKKSESFNALNDWSNKFLKSLAAQKKRGKVWTSKQVVILIDILNEIVDKGVIKRDSIDGDSEICERILDALGR